MLRTVKWLLMGAIFMSATKIVHCKKDSYDVMIDRTTKWGNPIKLTRILNHKDIDILKASHARLGQLINRDECLVLYEHYLRNSKLVNDIEELRGKTLGCWCKPKKCHGDVILKILKEREIEDLFGE